MSELDHKEIVKKDNLKLLIIYVGLIFLFLIFGRFVKTEFVSSKIDEVKKAALFIINKPTLQEVVASALEGSKGTYGIAIKNLKTQESYYLNEHKVFESASLYKLWIMAEAFEQIQNGKLSEDELLSEDVLVLNEEFNIDPNYAEMTNGEISLTVKNAINQMITISHNYSALLLTERIKISNVGNFLKKQGFTESKIGGSPQTTPYDIALFFEKLYKGQLANKENTQKMIDVLKKQALNDKLPKYLPKGTLIAHKTGEIDFLSHDGGIVFTKKGDYIIVVMSESAFPSGAEERIAGISKKVYEYFGRKNSNSMLDLF